MATKRLKKATRARKTVGALAARQRELARQRRQRYREKFTPEERSRLYQETLARCCDLPWLEGQCTVEPETGCWVWQGPWRRVFESARPEARRGSWGSMDAAKAAYLASGRPPFPAHCFLGRSCGRVECIAPNHLMVENQALRSAKRRSHNESQEGL